MKRRYYEFNSSLCCGGGQGGATGDSSVVEGAQNVGVLKRCWGKRNISFSLDS